MTYTAKLTVDEIVARFDLGIDLSREHVAKLVDAIEQSADDIECYQAQRDEETARADVAEAEYDRMHYSVNDIANDLENFIYGDVSLTPEQDAKLKAVLQRLIAL